MTRTDTALLNAIRVGLRGKPLADDPSLAADEWAALLRRSREQELLPLVYEAVYRCPSFRLLDRSVREEYRTQALQSATRQITQTNELLTLLLDAHSSGLDPVVIKGVVLRSLYPLPMLRPSVDEDLLVRPEEYAAYHRFLLVQGLSADDPAADISAARELSYHKENSPTYIELHTTPFPPDSEAYGACNALFTGALDRTVTVQIEDVPVRTLAPTDHLLYLICHAYKHLLHGGIGIRQICDAAMFTAAYDGEMNWDHILSACHSVRIDRFSAAMFRIAQRYLGFDMPPSFAGIEADETDLLEDILTGGLYGTADIDRLHSSTLTLDAVAADRTGKRRGGVLRSVFLPLRSMSGHFPYLRRYPVLLPVAWGQRAWGYLTRKKGGQSVHPAQSIRIGKARIALLRKYGIID